MYGPALCGRRRLGLILEQVNLAPSARDVQGPPAEKAIFPPSTSTDFVKNDGRMCDPRLRAGLPSRPLSVEKMLRWLLSRRELPGREHDESSHT